MTKIPLSVGFDVDNCLIWQAPNGQDVPRYRVIQLLDWFIRNGDQIYVWSGSGIDYAQKWVDKLGLTNAVTVVKKGGVRVDIAVDDQDVVFGKANIRINDEI